MNKIKTIYFCGMICILLFNCAPIPKDFTSYYTGMNTGIDSLVNINGYYVTQRECDTSFYSVFMFYPDGLFTIATTSEILPELVDCFIKGGNSAICKYPLWGTYYIENDTIKTQVIREEGVGICTIFRDYKITQGKQLININEYINPEYTKIGNMRNYPSFYSNNCPGNIMFYPLSQKRDISECPLLKRKWFNKSEK